MFLRKFIEFSILYNKLISKKFHNVLDIKLKIWNFYKRSIAKDIICKFIFNNTYQCTECFTIKWRICPKTCLNYNFYKVSACTAEPFDFTDTFCCEKRICSYNCYFNIKCKNCRTILNNISLPHLDDDIGWNPIEGKTCIDIICWHCECLNKIYLTMNDCNNDNFKWIGKQVYNNQNRFIIENGIRILYNVH